MESAALYQEARNLYKEAARLLDLKQTESIKAENMCLPEVHTPAQSQNIQDNKC